MRRGAALVIGFVGAMVIIRPGFVELSWPMIGVLLTSAAYALVNVTTKTLSVTDSSSKIVLYVFLGMTVLSVGPAIYTWNPIGVAHVPWILGLGLLSLLAVQGVTRALAAGEAAVVMPFQFYEITFRRCFRCFALCGTARSHDWFRRSDNLLQHLLHRPSRGLPASSKECKIGIP